MPTISADALRAFAVSMIRAAGAAQDEADRVGRSLIDANLRGYDSHGVMRIPFYLEALSRGEVVSGAELTVLKETATTLVTDANWGFGQVQANRLMQRLIQMGRQQGTATGTMIHASHIGRLGEYCESAASAGLISLLAVNTHGAARRVAPPGGTSPRLGTNPLAIGTPNGDRPLILDFSTSATAEGKVRVKKIAGHKCPDGWILDSQGRPTNDPNDLYAEPPGSILPMGGPQPYKGFGLAMMVDILAGALSGGLCSRETPLTQVGNCVFVYVCDPDHFGGKQHFASEVSQLVNFVESCPRVDGVETILLPGDPERRIAAEKQLAGIFLDNENWAQLTELADRLGVQPP